MCCKLLSFSVGLFLSLWKVYDLQCLLGDWTVEGRSGEPDRHCGRVPWWESSPPLFPPTSRLPLILARFSPGVPPPPSSLNLWLFILKLIPSLSCNVACLPHKEILVLAEAQFLGVVSVSFFCTPLNRWIRWHQLPGWGVAPGGKWDWLIGCKWHLLPKIFPAPKAPNLFRFPL